MTVTIADIITDGLVNYLTQKLDTEVNDLNVKTLRAGKLQDDPTQDGGLNILVHEHEDVSWIENSSDGDKAGTIKLPTYIMGGGVISRLRFRLEMVFHFITDDRAEARTNANIVVSRLKQALFTLPHPTHPITAKPVDDFGEKIILKEVSNYTFRESGGPGQFIWKGNFFIEFVTESNYTQSPKITPAPVADFTTDVNYLEVTFNNTSSDALVSQWNFGDGNTSKETSPFHTYLLPGVYNPTLFVGNHAGIDIVSKQIQIYENIGYYPEQVLEKGYNVWNWDASRSIGKDGNPLMYQDSAATIPVTMSMEPVGTWIDSVQGVHAKQATTANKPMYTSNKLNGLPMMVFTTGSMTTNVPIALSTFAIWIVGSTHALSYLYAHPLPSGVPDYSFMQQNYSRVRRNSIESVANYDTSIIDSVNESIFRHEFNGTGSTNLTYKNNTLITNANADVYLGTDEVSAAFQIAHEYGVREYAEIVVISPYPDQVIIDQMEDYLNTKWGVYEEDAILDASQTYTVFDWDASRSDTLFQDSSATTPVTSDTDPVGAWVDRISSINAIQSTTANKPTYSTGTLNGLPTLSFDGGDILATANISISTFAVWMVYNCSVGGTIASHTTDPVSVDGFNINTFGTNSIQVRRTTRASKNGTDLSGSVNRIVRFEHNGTYATFKYFNNGSEIATTDNIINDVGTGTATQPLFMGARSGVAFPITGNIAELVIVTPYPDATTIARIEAQLNAKWGVY